MASLITIFKLLRCIGLFPRRFLSANEPNHSLRRQVIGKNESIVGPLSPFLLLMTIIFHITRIFFNIMNTFEAANNSQDYDNNTFNKFGLISLNVLWIWSSSLAGWSILINNNKLKRLNDALILLQSYQNKEKRIPAKFPRGRLFWIVLIPMIRLTFFVVYFSLNVTATAQSIIIWIVGAIEDEIIKFTIEFTFWQISKLYRSIITHKSKLTQQLSFRTPCRLRKSVLYCKSGSKTSVDAAECLRNCCYKNVGKKLLDFNLLQTEKYIESIINCVQLAMTCFNYAIVFQLIDLGFAVLFGLYFEIIYTNAITKVFALFDIAHLIPRLVLIVTLSNTINDEVRI